MGKDTFEFARIASPEEIAEYLGSLATGLKRGEVRLESGGSRLTLSPAADVRIGLKVKDKGDKGRITLEIGWKRWSGSRASDLRVQSGPRPGERDT